MVKGVPESQATIVAMEGNFHGRTTTIVSFSTDHDARDHFGPYTPGFEIVPYGDLTALEAAVTENTVAVLLEARASEHSSRMVARKNATDNAKQLIKDLTLEYNKLRQAAITNELLEITTAKMALE